MSRTAHEENEPLSMQLRVDEVCLQFEAAWKANPQPHLEAYLGDTPEPEYSVLLRALILVDVAYRRRQGQEPKPVEYQARFPGLDAEWICRVLAPPGEQTVSGMPASSCSQQGEPSSALPLSFARGRYQIQRFLGEGAVKRVYLAHDTSLDRPVALSVFKTERLDQAGLARVHREARALGRLGDHPHIVTIYDTAEEDGQPYLVSQYMEGGSVHDLLSQAEKHRLPLHDVLHITDEICQALEYAHQNNIVHRDLKPMNVWLTQTGTVKLGDFGLAVVLDQARLTTEGVVVGTVAYMAPEQAEGQAPQAASDLYSLGVMFYEMVTGRRPFLGEDVLAVLYQHIHTPPVAPSWHNPEVPRPLQALILRLLAKAPHERPQSAAAVRKALQAIAANEPSSCASAEPRETANPLDRLAGGIFVGREPVMRALRGGLEDALAGHGRLFLLVGEPGVGKTRTAEELITYARLRGAQALVGRCHESEGAPAHWPWVQIIRSYLQDREPEELRTAMGSGARDIAQVVSEIRERLPDLPAQPALEGEQARFRLFDSVTTFLKKAGQQQPLVLVLEDLHWWDQPSLLLLQFLARELKHSRLLVVGSYRDLDLGRQHPLVQTLGELTRERLSQRLLLQGLSEPDVGRFLDIALGQTPPAALVAAIYRETEGNPFFVTEVVRFLLTEGCLSLDRTAPWTMAIPQSVREVIGHRLDRLSPECNQVLGIASVVGREFALNVLERVGELSGDQLLEKIEEAMAARVVFEMPRALGRYSFAHALIRETLYDELSMSRRVRLHRQIGTVLERLYADNPESHLAELAHHFYQAIPGGDLDKALAYAVRAGDWAAKRLAFEEAASHYERALQMLELQEPAEGQRALVTNLRAKRGAAFANVGMWPDARSALEAALEDLAPECREQHAEIRAELAMVCFFLVDVPSMRRHAAEALALAEKVGRADLASKAWSWLAEAKKNGGDLQGTLELYGRAIGCTKEPYPVALAHVALPLFWLGRFDEAIVRSREAIQVAREHNDISTLVFGLPHLGLALAAKGQYAEAAAIFEEARLLGRK
jgi:tRNA A-37 threonylcarbamoyl transferase component Bud32